MFIGVVVGNNGESVFLMGDDGTSRGITIPSLMITQTDATKLLDCFEKTNHLDVQKTKNEVGTNAHQHIEFNKKQQEETQIGLFVKHSAVLPIPKETLKKDPKMQSPLSSSEKESSGRNEKNNFKSNKNMEKMEGSSETESSVVKGVVEDFEIRTLGRWKIRVHRESKKNAFSLYIY